MASYVPISDEPDLAGYIFTVPSLSVTENVVYIEYVSSETTSSLVDTLPFAIVPVAVPATTSSLIILPTSPPSQSGLSSLESFTTGITIVPTITITGTGTPESSTSIGLPTLTPSLSAEAPNKSKIPAIIGGIIGSLLCITIAILSWTLYHRRRRARHRGYQRRFNRSSRLTLFNTGMMAETGSMEIPSESDPSEVIVQPNATVSRTTGSVGSSKNSDMDGFNEKGPTLEGLSPQAIIARALIEYRGDVDDDGRSTLASTTRMFPSTSSSSYKEGSGEDQSINSQESDNSFMYHISKWALGMTNRVPK
ncbi:uncharacterized protein C8R40DRAFT_416537 [Lentinula edodes]|uniref:uncharacterized protein n=1 Tax=Lentinula edodes TaxID=5353 RepID=UPI001E8D86D2|nr:uncharacterized protein C8R40DRAFT_416537 [Lentinula edodes]KAH7872748.1 hypothetical protein C8R40DRAFT_416537 [Lentinula edodes]